MKPKSSLSGDESTVGTLYLQVDRTLLFCGIPGGDAGSGISLDVTGHVVRHCKWCDLLEAGSFLSEEPAFVVLAPGASKCSGGHLTLVPRAHESLLTRLEPEEMASVLAGLSSLVLSLKRTHHVRDVEVRVHPRIPSEHHPHLHFHLIPREVPVARSDDPVLKMRGA